MASKSEALKQVYASAPVDAVLFETLEINHPDFIDNNGNHAAVRIVMGYEDLNAKLEADAPMNPGETVVFTAVQFEVTVPGIDEQTGQLLISLDNVGREIISLLEQAMSSPKQASVIYREYLLSDLSGPQMDPPLELQVVTVDVDIFQCQITCDAGNMQNFAFPAEQYNVARFPGLNR